MFLCALNRVLLVILTLSLASSLFAQEKNADPLGTWEWERKFNDNSMAFKLTLEKGENGKLTGDYTVNRGDNKGEPTKPRQRQFRGRQIGV